MSSSGSWPGGKAGSRVRVALCVLGTALAMFPSTGSFNRTRIEEADPELNSLRIEGANAFNKGDLDTAERFFEKGYQLADQKRNLYYKWRFKSNVASIAYARYQFRAALSGYLEAKTLAEVSGDTNGPALMAINLTSLYTILGETEAANRAAEAGVASGKANHAGHYAEALASLGLLRSRQGKSEEA